MILEFFQQIEAQIQKRKKKRRERKRTSKKTGIILHALTYIFITS